MKQLWTLLIVSLLCFTQTDASRHLEASMYTIRDTPLLQQAGRTTFDDMIICTDSLSKTVEAQNGFQTLIIDGNDTENTFLPPEFSCQMLLDELSNPENGFFQKVVIRDIPQSYARFFWYTFESAFSTPPFSICSALTIANSDIGHNITVLHTLLSDSDYQKVREMTICDSSASLEQQEWLLRSFPTSNIEVYDSKNRPLLSARDASKNRKLSVLSNRSAHSLTIIGNPKGSEFKYDSLSEMIGTIAQTNSSSISTLNVRDIPESYADTFWDMLSKIFEQQILEGIPRLKINNANVGYGFESLQKIIFLCPKMRIEIRKDSSLTEEQVEWLTGPK